MKHKILFISSSERKRLEIQRISDRLGMNIVTSEQGWTKKVKEIQTDDIEELMKDKVKRTYEQVKRPVLVEHTVLKINALNGCPGTHTEFFWDKLKGKMITKLLRFSTNRDAEVITYFAYCDGKVILRSEGSVKGKIARKVSSCKEAYAWDSIFIPEGENKTYAELDTKKLKDKYSMRRIGLEELKDKLEKHYAKAGTDELELFEVGMDPEMISAIAKRIIEGNLILFVGAGLSANVKLPSWGQLIDVLGKDLGYDKEVFHELGDYLSLAEYHDIKSKKDQHTVKDYFTNAVNIEVKNKIKNSEIYRSLTRLDVPRIYTTNYENLLEVAHEIHVPHKSVKPVYNLKTINDGQKADVEIVKLHGDLNDEKNMVFTQSSYFKRYTFENSLDILLRSDLLNKSVLFLGYSFSDANVQYMFYKLNQLWGEEDREHRPKSYIFVRENNPVQRTIFKEKFNIETIVSEDLDPGKGLESFLQELVNAVEKAKAV